MKSPSNQVRLKILPVRRNTHPGVFLSSFVSFAADVSIICLGLFILSGCVAETVPESPSQVTSRLVALLSDPQPDVRRTAALSLGKIADPSSIPALTLSASDPDAEVRKWSAWALGNLGDHLQEESQVALVQLLADSSSEVKQAATMALGRATASEKVLKIIGQAYAISSSSTQQAIVQTLSNFSSPFAYGLFLEASESPVPFIRQAAMAGMAELGDPRGLPVLRRQLLQDVSIGVRAEAAYRLGKIGGQKEIGPLEQARDTDPTPTVHLWSVWALNQLRDQI